MNEYMVFPSHREGEVARPLLIKAERWSIGGNGDLSFWVAIEDSTEHEQVARVHKDGWIAVVNVKSLV